MWVQKNKNMTWSQESVSTLPKNEDTNCLNGPDSWLIFVCELKPQITNPTITPSGRKVTEGERRERKNALNYVKLCRKFVYKA